jgi:preprotein translocase subunit YajC
LDERTPVQTKAHGSTTEVGITYIFLTSVNFEHGEKKYCIISLQEGKKVHTGGGFSGKGFKFDEAEAMMVSEKKKFQKAALGNIFSFTY